MNYRQFKLFILLIQYNYYNIFNIILLILLIHSFMNIVLSMIMYHCSRIHTDNDLT